MDKINKVYEMVEMICFNGCEEPEITNEVLTTINSVRDQITQLTEKLEAWRGLKIDLDCIELEEGNKTEVLLSNKIIQKLRGFGEIE